MKIIDWMRKLGILRYGSKNYSYTSGKDMPSEALIDDVYDAKKDLFFDEDGNKDNIVQENKPKKGVHMWKKILGIIVVIIGIFVGLVMWGTSGMTETANEFFILVKTKNYDDAYNSTSEDFKHSVSLEKFESFIKSSGLSDYKSVSWNSRSIESGIGELTGSVTTKSGDEIPIVMQFLKSGEQWKIFSLSKQKAGLQNLEQNKDEVNRNTIKEKSIVNIPEKEKLRSLIQESTFLFAESVNVKSMSGFYDNISKVWREQTTVEELDRVFTPFYKAEIDLTVLKNITPLLDKEPVLINDIELVLEGHYPTTPSAVYFNYSFINDKGMWKLIGFNLNIK